MKWDPTDLQEYINHVRVIRFHGDVLNSTMVEINPKLVKAIAEGYNERAEMKEGSSGG